MKKFEQVDSCLTKTDKIFLTIANINVQSLGNKIDNFTHFLNDQNVNIGCITEHWLSSGILDRIFIENYVVASAYCRRSSRHGGAAIILRNNIPFKELSEIKDLSVDRIIEMTAIRIAKRNLTVVAVYRPPSGDFETFESIMNQALEICLQKYPRDHLVFAGDYNVNFRAQTKEKSKTIELFKSFNMNYMFSDPSHETKSSTSCIDNMFTNVSAEDSTAFTYEPHLSDHFAQILKISCTHFNPEKETFKTVRPINDKNTHLFIQKMRDEDWTLVYAEDAKTQYNIFHRRLMHIFNISFPEKKIKMNKHKKYKSSKEIKDLKNKLEAAKIIADVKRDENSEKLCKMLKTKLKKVITDSVRTKYSKQVEEAENKTQVMWKLIKQQTQKKNNSSASDEVVTADEMNKYFTNIGREMARSVGPNLQESSSLLHRSKLNNPDSMYLSPVTEDEIVDSIMKVKNKTAKDYYGMTIQLLKCIIPYIKTPLCKIVNDCFIQGVFPAELKIAIVTPLHKGGDTEDHSNYRPISVLPVFSKVFEIALRKRLVDYFENNSLLHTAQHGFRQYRSTITAMLEVLDTILDAYNDSEEVEMTSVDLSKAFDSVCHELLLEKLHYYGIRGLTHKLIQSYLTGRYQSVKWNGCRSDLIEVECGVPQGSILGPIFFILFMNDIFYNINSGMCSSYADDVVILNRSDSRSDLNDRTSVSEVDAQKWFSANGLLMNSNKTQKLVFTNREQTDSSLLYLGLEFQPSLNWSKHIDNLCKKLSTSIFLIRRMSQITDTNIAKLTHYSSFHSVATYGILLWGQCADSQKILLKQKSAIRAIYQMKTTDSCREIFKRERILTITSYFILTCVKYVHQHRNKFPKNSFYHNYNTREKNNYALPYSRIKKTQQGPNHTCLKLYNKLPNDIKTSNLSAFIRKVKNLLLENTIYNLTEFLN